MLLLFVALSLPRAVWAEEVPAALSDWMHAEQKLNNREVDTKKIIALTNHQDPKYAPASGAVFDIKTYWVDANKMHALMGEGLSSSLKGMFTRTKAGKQQVRLLVHPESASFYKKVTKNAVRGKDLKASATASSRTLLVWPSGKGESACFVKVSLNKEIGGVVRTVPKGEVARSIGINNTLHTDRSVLPKTFQFLPEVVGLMPKGMDRGGMIVREIPKSILEGKTKVVPMFSLYAKPAGRGEPMLATMIKKSGMDPQRFVREKITRPFAKQFMALGLKNGVVMEPHAQNVLIEVGAKGQPTGRFFHRDLGGFNVDYQHRAEMKRPDAHTPTITTRAEDYHEAHHNDSLASALDAYFQGGFLHNAEKHARQWQKDGLIKGQAIAKGAFKADLIGEVEASHKTLTGKSLALKGNLRNLSKAIPAGRKSVTKERVKRRSVFGKFGHLARARVRVRQALRGTSGRRKAKAAKNARPARVRAAR
jgi:hypothetical protein